MNKEELIQCADDQQHNDWEKGDKGYIDGYLASDGMPYMVVINLRTKQPVLVCFGGVIEIVD